MLLLGWTCRWKTTCKFEARNIYFAAFYGDHLTNMYQDQAIFISFFFMDQFGAFKSTVGNTKTQKFH